MSCFSFLPCLPAFDQLARPVSLRHQIGFLALQSSLRLGRPLRPSAAFSIRISSDLAMLRFGEAGRYSQQAPGSA
jgi:hypothetical protein